MLITQGSLVRAQLDPPKIPMSGEKDPGGLAQLGEHLLCKQGVVGSIPSSSTKNGALKVLQSKASQYKSSLRQTAFVLRYISIGCSLKIHRVEISVAGGKRNRKIFAPCRQQHFDCVKTDILRMRNYLVMTNIL